jgi:hypothetical protein
VVGEWAWLLLLLHHPIASLDVKGRGKLGPKFFRPFRVTKKIDDVANRLQLLAGARLHDVFHAVFSRSSMVRHRSLRAPFLQYDMVVHVPLRPLFCAVDWLEASQNY